MALADSAPLVHDPEALRLRAARDGCLLLRGIPGREAVRPLRVVVEEAVAALGLLLPQDGSNAAPLVTPGAALTGTGYDDRRWLTLQEQVLADARFVALGDDATLLSVLQVLLGGEVLSRRGDICRLALPNARHLTTPPHQDHWYTGGTIKMWTVWIPLTDTPLELGPLAVLPGSHRSGLLPHDGDGAGRQGVRGLNADHFAASELAAGDAILFSSLTVHCALPNATRDRVRISVDYRYQAADEPIHVMRVDGTRAGA
jgi:ectoine hydroxylase-related dioxygenase (phytanoyl-CoA dioxygenase family)